MATYLIDESALARMRQQAVASRLAPIIEDGEGATCAIIELEVIYSARNASEYDRLRRRRTLAYDSDFDTIADVTGQAIEWVVPRCSAG